MAGKCKEDHYWDGLVKKCLHCEMECKSTHANLRCASYCDSANCTALPGHYYDDLLKRCLRCADICGGHPAECSQHCHTLPPPTTIKKLMVDLTSHVPSGGLRHPIVLGDPTILLYPLLALCMVLLFSSLSLALVVFLRKPRAKTSNPGPMKANHNQESEVQLVHKVGQPGCQPRQSSNDFVTMSSPTAREPSDDSIPTETCVCVHCFPDLKALGQGNDRQPRAPSALYPHTALHRAQMEKGGPLWTEVNLHTSGREVQQEAAVESGTLAFSRNNWNGQMCP